MDSPEVPPENRPSVTSAQALPRPLPLRKRGRVQHLLHAGAAARPLVPDDHDVAGTHRAVEDALDGVLLRLEDPAGPAERSTAPRRRPAVFTIAPSGADVAVQDGQPAVGGVGVRHVPDAPGRRVEVQRVPAGRLRVRLRGPHAAGRGVIQLHRLVRHATRPRGPRQRCGMPVHRVDGPVEQPGPVQLAEDRRDAAGPVHVLDVVLRPCSGATLHRHGTRRDSSSISFRPKSTPPSCAAASRCRIVLVDPPIATSSAMAFSNASLRGDGARQHRLVVVLVVPPGDLHD